MHPSMRIDGEAPTSYSVSDQSDRMWVIKVQMQSQYVKVQV